MPDDARLESFVPANPVGEGPAAATVAAPTAGQFMPMDGQPHTPDQASQALQRAASPTHGDGPEDLGIPHDEVAVDPPRSTLGSTSTVPNGFMTEHPDESLAGAQNKSAEPDTQVGGLDKDVPTTEPVSVPPPVIEEDEHTDQMADKPQAEVHVGPAPIEGAGGGPAPIVSVPEAGPVAPPIGAEVAPTKGLTPRSNAAGLSPEQASNAQPTVPQHKNGLKDSIKSWFRIGTPAPEPPQPKLQTQTPTASTG